MGILSWILVGLVAGFLAGVVMKGSGYGIVGDILVGIVGAILGGFLAGWLFGVPDPLTGFDLRTLLIGFLGSVILIALVRALPGRSPV